jgi:serine/threonine protein kinase
MPAEALSQPFHPFPADVWSIGSVMFVLAFFEHPYLEALPGDPFFDAIVSGKFPFHPAYPPAFYDFLRAVFRSNPQRRPTAAVFVSQLCSTMFWG